METTKKQLKAGDHIIYVDPKGVRRDALCNIVWGAVEAYKSDAGEPGCNLVFITNDETRTDTYGAQIERATSVVHKSKQPAHGNYWCWPSE